MSEWRYIAQRIRGDGAAGEFLDWNLPLTNVGITSTLSGPGALTATVPMEDARLRGQDIFRDWGTAIWAEADGEIKGGGILVGTTFQGPSVEVTCMGLSGYPQGMPYLDYGAWVQIDPLFAARHIWQHLQSQPGGNLGVVVDETTSPVRIGKPLENVAFTTGAGEEVDFEAGPYKLAWWQTDDLGAEFDKLAQSTPFDYNEETRWVGDQLEHRLRLHYPRKGQRRHDLRFAIGENIAVIPSASSSGEEYANEVLFLGAGEGRDMVRGTASRSEGRLRRAVVASDKAARSKLRANAGAKAELALRTDIETITSISVVDHQHAPFGSFDIGDEILVQGDFGWLDVYEWHRITSMTISPNNRVRELTLLRSDRIAA